MAGQEPVVTQPYSADEAKPLPTWAEARRHLEQAQFCWLATARPDGRPHVMPVLAVWLDGALYFSASPASRKGKNLAYEPHCVIAVDRDGLHLVVEGEAAQVSDEAQLQRVAEVYAVKYGWQVTVRDGAFYAEGAPTAGPPPYAVYRVTRRWPLASARTSRSARPAGASSERPHPSWPATAHHGSPRRIHAQTTDRARAARVPRRAPRRSAERRQRH